MKKNQISTLSLRGNLYVSMGVFLILLIATMLPQYANAQTSPCTAAGMGQPQSFESRQSQIVACSPAEYELTWGVKYSREPPPNHTYEYVFRWGDRQEETVAVTSAELSPAGDPTTYTKTHTYPADGACLYTASMVLRIDGQQCNETLKTFNMSNWSSENSVNQDGEVQLRAYNGTSIVFTGGSIEVEVCEGENINVRFFDETRLNCQGGLTPNDEDRWREVVYNTSNGNKIPSVTIGGVPVTDAQGSDINADYSPVPVELLDAPNDNTFTKANILSVVAPGGFGPNDPVGGDEFQITLRYWNICNPVGTPASEATATIRIVGAPTPPVLSDTLFCVNNNYSSYEVNATSTTLNPYFLWYNNDGTGILQYGGDNFNPLAYYFPPTLDSRTNGGTVNVRAAVSGSIILNNKTCLSDTTSVSYSIYPRINPGRISIQNVQGSSLTICSGVDPGIFTATTPTGGNGVYTYQWQQSVNWAPFTDIAGGTNETFDIPALTIDTRYSRQVFSSDGVGGTNRTCAESVSNIFYFTVEQRVNAGAVGSDQTVCIGGAPPATLTNITFPTLGNSSYSYQWESVIIDPTTVPPTTFNVEPNSNNSSFTPPQNLLVNTWYRRAVSSGACTSAPNDWERTSWVLITVNSSIQPGTIEVSIPPNGTSYDMCLGDTPPGMREASAPSGGANYTYQWLESTQSGSQYSVIPGATSQAGYTPLSVTNTTYYVRSVSSGICSINSGEVAINVHPLPTATIVGGGSICGPLSPSPDVEIKIDKGSAPWTLVFSIDGVDQTPVTVQETFVGSKRGIHTISSPGAGVYRVTSVTDDQPCQATSNSLGGTVTVGNAANSTSAITGIVPTSAICHEGTNTNPPDAVITFSPAGAVNYRVKYSVVGIDQLEITRASNTSGDLTLTVPYSSWNSLPGTIPLEVKGVVDISTGCAIGLLANNSVDLVVNNVPVITINQDKNICSRDNANYKIMMSGALEANTRFTWTKNGVVEDKLASETFHITDQLTNITISSQREEYSVTPSTLSCTGASENVTIIVNPEPVITTGQRTTICSNTALSYAIRMQNSPLGTSVTWTHPIDGTLETVDVQNIPTIRDVLANTSTNKTDEMHHYKLIAESGAGCTSIRDSVEVVVYPLPEISALNVDKDVCLGQSVDYEILLDPVGIPTNTRFSWASPLTGQLVEVSAGPPSTIHIDDTYTTPGIRRYGVTAISDKDCRSLSKTITIDVNSSPPLSNISRYVCETIITGQTTGSGVGTIDLTSLEVEIGKTLLNGIEWYASYDANSGNLSAQILSGSNPGETENYAINRDVQVYGRIISSSGAGCESVSEVTLVYQTAPVSNAIAYTGPGIRSAKADPDDFDAYNICMDPTQTHIFQITPSVSSSTNTITETYQWEYPTPKSQLLSGGNDIGVAITLQFPVGIASKYDTVFVTEYHNGCSGARQGVVVNTESIAGKSIISGIDTLCAGNTNIAYGVSGAPASSLYTWILPAGVSFVSNTVQTGSSVQLNFPSQILVASSGVQIVVEIQTGDAKCVADPADPLDVLIVQNPIMSSGTQGGICSGQATSSVITLASQGGPIGTTYNWQITNITGTVSNANVGDIQLGVMDLGGNKDLQNRSGLAGSVSYRVTPVGADRLAGGNSCVGPDQSVIIEVKPEPVIIPSQSKTVCSNNAIDYEILLSPINLPAQTMFNWPAPVAGITIAGSNVSSGNKGTVHIRDNINNISTVSDTYTYVVTPNDGQTNLPCIGGITDVVIRVNPEPVGADDNINICSSASLNYNLQNNLDGASASGTGLNSSFSWYADDNPNVQGESRISGIKTSGIIDDKLINYTNVEQNVVYRVTPTNELLLGAPSCDGSVFTVTVTVRPEPVGSADDIDICSDVPLGYDLQNNINNATGGLSTGITYVWTTLPNPDIIITPATLSTNVINDNITNVTISDQQVIYTVTPTYTDAFNNTCEGSDFDIRVTISPEPQGATYSSTICSRSTPNISLQNIINTSGNKLGATFKWIGATNPSVTGISITQSLNAVIDDILGNVTGTQHDVVYTVTPSTVSSAGRSCEGDDFLITITVNPEPVATALPDYNICSGVDQQYDIQIKNIDVGGNSVPSTFRWLAAPNIDVGGEQITTQLTDDITGVLTNRNNMQSRVVYTVTPTSRLGSCVGANFEVGVVVMPEPVGFNYQFGTCGGVPLNYDLQTSNIDMTQSGGNALPSTFTWQAFPNANVNGLSITAQTSNIINDIVLNQGSRSETVSYAVIPESTVGKCTGNNFEISIQVNPQPQSASSSHTICSGVAVNRNLTSNISNTLSSTYVWKATDNANVEGESLTDQISGSIGDILVNKTGIDQQVEYTVTPTGAANKCVGNPFIVNVTVNPEPVGISENFEICSNQILAYDLQNNINSNNAVPSTFRWKSRNSVLEIGGESTVEKSTDLIQDDLTNITTSDQVLLYDVIPASVGNSCEGSQFTISLTVHPKPNVNDATGLDICSGEAFDYNLSDHLTNSGNGLVANTAYAWSAPASGNVTGQSTTIRNGNIIDDVLTLNTGVITNYVIRYAVTPIDQTNNCSGVTFSVEVLVKPTPIGFEETTSLCSGLSLSFSLVDNINKGNSFVSNTTYEWFAIDNTNVTGETLVTSKTTNLLDDQLVNITTANQIVMYSYIPSNSNGCQGNTVNITVNLTPSPILDPNLAQKSICSQSLGNTNPVGIILGTSTNSIPATGYNITSDLGTIPGFTGMPTQGNNQPFNAIATDSYNNVTTSVVDVTYTIVPRSLGACLGTPVDVVVTVHPEPVVNPNLNASVCSGLVSGITLSTDGTSVAADSYTLTNLIIPRVINFRPDNSNTFVASSGVSSLIDQDIYINTSSTDISVDYEIRATSASAGSGGGCIGEPQIITLTVKPQPVLDSTAPSPVCSGLTSGIIMNTLTSSVVATKYKINGITRSSTSLVVGTNNASISSIEQPANILSNDVFFNSTTSALTVIYKIVPISGEQCVGTENNLVLTVNPAPAVADDLDATACSGGDAGVLFNTGAGVAATTYDIVAIDVATGLNVAVTGNATIGVGLKNDAIRTDKFENTTNDPLGVTYTISGKSASQCIGPQKDVLLVIEPVIVATPVANIANICSDSKIDIVLNSPTNPTSGNITFDYTVTSATGQVSGFVNSQANLPLGYKIENQLANTSNGQSTITYFITAVAEGAMGGNGCVAPASVPVDVTIEPRPVLIPIPDRQVVCEGTATSIDLTTNTLPSIGGIGFDVVSVIPTGGMTLSSPSSQVTTYLSGEFIVDEWSNPTLDDKDVVYVLLPKMDTGLGCMGEETEIIVTVRPNPELSPVAQQAMCSHTSLSIPLIIDLPGAYANWTVSASSSIVGVSNGGGNRINMTPINNSFASETITYLVSPRIDACVGDPVSILIDVNPLPNTRGLPTNTRVCNGQTLNLPLSSDVLGSTTFDWTVLDAYGLGTQNQFDGSGTVIDQFFDNQLGYQVILVYAVTPTSEFSCVGTPSFMNVEVTSIVPEITPNRTQICSGESVRVVNTSLGATQHRWFYRVQGTADEIDVTTDPSANYVLGNNTSLNPIYYEIIYEASNGTCSKPGIATPPIAVYHSVNAGFDEGVIPPIRGGISTVNFTNTSDPIEENQFRYEWDFGQGSAPTQYNGVTPPPVVYNRQGPRDVILRAINNDSEAAGLSCEDVFTVTILVPTLPLIAEFEVNQTESCVPVKITINNKSTGNENEWKVVDENGQVIITENTNNPEFTINNSGEYTIFLTTRDSFTGEVAVSNISFVVYQDPEASFSARPYVVFVPDVELLVSNSSERANVYLWDFGDDEFSDEKNPPAHKYRKEGVYDLTLIAMHDYGNGIVCSDTTFRRITAKSGGTIKVPNAFTPNQDSFSSDNPGDGGGGIEIIGEGGLNDVFLPIVQGVNSFNMQIYDRWGNLVFESNKATVGWDGRNEKGKLMPAGVYVYKLEVQLADGNAINKIGDLTMLR